MTATGGFCTAFATSVDDTDEIGAEIFAAELIFPDSDFSGQLCAMGVAAGRCSAEDIVRLKDDTGTTLSYSSLAKRAEIMGFAAPGSLVNVRWRVLAEAMLGEPLYKTARSRPHSIQVAEARLHVRLADHVERGRRDRLARRRRGTRRAREACLHRTFF